MFSNLPGSELHLQESFFITHVLFSHIFQCTEKYQTKRLLNCTVLFKLYILQSANALEEKEFGRFIGFFFTLVGT